MDEQKKQIYVTISFEKTTLPPFDDVLVLGKECPLGMNGVGQCIDLLVPDGFDRFEVDDDHVAAIIVNKNILKRIKPNKLIEILSSRVFPYIGKKEVIKVDFKLKIAYDSFTIDED